MKQTLIITGIKDIDRRLRTLEPRIQKKVVRQAMRRGMKLMADAVRSRVPIYTGLSRKAVKVRAVKKRKRSSIMIEVALSSKIMGTVKPSPKGAVFYPAVVEYKKHPFMRPAFQAKGEATRQYIINDLRFGIEREIAAKA